MSNGDQLPLYTATQLPVLFSDDASCKFIALKIKSEEDNTALHAIYIEQQSQPIEFPFGALITVTEWEGKSEREEFFIEAESVELLMEKLQRFDEVNSFVFLQVPNSVTIDTVTMQPQQLFCLLFPELGGFNSDAPEEIRFGLKNSSVALLHRLESSKSNI
ncbi:hypothetical protein CW745_09035 [Psychromonas sp. psych-6C06]|uniref:hypothetical protein n=1 Tax=Psychromonas sp. psych-6C06 TaxID=2058089 RepID=UPI000C32398A|nr:hypothetical protein [Psychromonas sp. psych-6C06]PKF61470.1 hypothetical protein CW745_09035 [Psychromonas sp. psych-6C06]